MRSWLRQINRSRCRSRCSDPRRLLLIALLTTGIRRVLGMLPIKGLKAQQSYAFMSPLFSELLDQKTSNNDVTTYVLGMLPIKGLKAQRSYSFMSPLFFPNCLTKKTSNNDDMTYSNKHMRRSMRAMRVHMGLGM